jgi:hypothetical protein
MAADRKGTSQVTRLEDLTDDQRCVLLNAVEESDLYNVLMECAPGRDWAELSPHLPGVARIVENFVQEGIVSLYTYADGADAADAIVDIPDDEAPAIIAESANWAPGREPLICLSPTDKGLALYRGEAVSTDPIR